MQTMATGTPLKVKFKVTCNAATDEDRVVEIPGDLTVAQIKKKHFATELGERCRIRFIHQGRELSEGETVEDCWRRSGLPHVGCVQKRGQTGRTSAPSSSSSSSSSSTSFTAFPFFAFFAFALPGGANRPRKVALRIGRRNSPSSC
mmetsp:Transcript_13067/g.25632  ORF Transcript_13067/g.25632 Transcript_13067/m.25632 type:complete len:146 (+) Transcript_13067:213-650(+)